MKPISIVYLAPGIASEAEHAVRRMAHSHRPVNHAEDGFPIAVYIAWNALDAQLTAETAV
jgi:hypothetical protein